jgi:hypothetical protein
MQSDGFALLDELVASSEEEFFPIPAPDTLELS